ncbi:MAG: transcription termination/antitermination protein NusG [Candidatus Auribacterota bacterium]|jgi:transcriptional antiterminator NusG|nr:transcription termination/antitermination protein NusG [Candidatus Auribacterota bacterium]
MAFEWYVVHTLSGQESKVKESLEHKIKLEELGGKIKQVLIPTEHVSEVKSGKKRISERKFFPGYILVEMNMDEDVWHFIKNTNGIIGFVGGGKPVPLMPEEVDNIVRQIEDRKKSVKPKITFEKGEVVKIKEGPFVNFSGVIEDIDPDRGKLRVMITIFGRATPLELEYSQVERT